MSKSRPEKKICRQKIEAGIFFQKPILEKNCWKLPKTHFGTKIWGFHFFPKWPPAAILDCQKKKKKKIAGNCLKHILEQKSEVFIFFQNGRRRPSWIVKKKKKKKTLLEIA